MLFSAKLFSQTINALSSNPTTAEMGVPQFFTFAVFNLPASVTITSWKFTSDVDVCITGTPQGYINLPNNPFYTDYTGTTLYTVPVVWGDCCNTTKTVKLTATISYSNGGTVPLTASATQTVTLYKIPCIIPITGPDTAPNCCPTTLTYTAGDTGDANKYQWSVASGNAQILSGASTKTITVNPNTGNFTLNFATWRSTNTPYVKVAQKAVTRTNLSASLSMPLYNGNTQDFVCKGSGINATLTINSGGCPNPVVTWTAPNCTVTSLGNNLYNIVPLSTATVGSIVSVYATVNVNSCSSTTLGFPLKIVDSQAPTVPNGYLSYTYGGDFCTTPIFNITYVDNTFKNGVTTISPDYMYGPGDPVHYKPSVSRAYTVCNKNLCTGATSCKTFYFYPPAPCSPAAKNAQLLVYPNPTTTNDTFVENASAEDGTYEIYSMNNVLIKSGKVKTNEKVNINVNNIQNGQYIIVLKTASNSYSKQLMIKK